MGTVKTTKTKKKKGPRVASLTLVDPGFDNFINYLIPKNVWKKKNPSPSFSVKAD